ncbi:MAG: FecR domain-containing protein [Rubrivivax sp.]|nr:FecR domain-containing protein [Rubrivivax sp.]
MNAPAMPATRSTSSGPRRSHCPSLAGLAVLVLASSAAAQPPAEGTLEHRIHRGDTLIGLHARLMRPQADWRVVQRLNRIADPRRLRPGSTLRIPLSMLREEPVSAEVLHSHGEVFVERAGAPPAPLPAAALLRAGDVVTTGAQSSASLRFADGSRALLGPGGRLRVERHVRRGANGGVDTLLRLDSGAMETRVQPARPAPRFELRTPVANLGVRGTDFRARLDGERLLSEVLQGRVAVGTTALNAGFGTVATPGRVAPPRPLPAAPDLTALPGLLERLPLQFRFAPAAGAARYRAQVFDASGDERLILDGLFDTPLATWPDSPPDGRYELRVRAADAGGVEGRAASSAFTLKARPEPPFQLKPRAGERLLDATVAFGWSAHPEAARYRLQVSAAPDFTAPLIDRSDLTGTEFGASLPLGTWYWRLATVRASGDTGPWGDAVTLERADPPPPPPAPPVEPPKTSDAGLVMRWAASPLTGARYQVQVARDAAFTQLVVDETTAATEWLLPQPAPGTYHLRVRSLAPDGRAGDFGAAQVAEISGSRWWLWLLPLLLLL